jgi:putative transposase
VALDQSALLEVLDALKTAEVSDRVRQAAQTIYQALIEAELTSLIGAAPHQRTPDRSAQRNGHRPRLLATTAGDLELRIPKLRAGSFFPSLLERRRRVDQALFAVVMEAYLHGVSTRKVDDLVRALGADSGISKSEVSRICGDLDAEVSAFRDRSLAGQSFPMSLSTPPTARPGSTAESSPRPWWSPLACAATAAGKSSALPSVTARTGRSGPSSSGRSRRVG